MFFLVVPVPQVTEWKMIQLDKNPTPSFLQLFAAGISRRDFSINKILSQCRAFVHGEIEGETILRTDYVPRISPTLHF